MWTTPIAAILGILAAYVASRRTWLRGIGRGTRPRARAAVTGLLAFVVVEEGVVCGTCTGPFRCEICGRVERRQSVFGIPVFKKARTTGWAEAGAKFAEWRQRELGDDHDHDWSQAGCLYTGRWTVSCAMQERMGETFYRVVPVLPDEAHAHSLANRLRTLPRDRRRELLRDFGRTGEEECRVKTGELPALTTYAMEREWVTLYPEWLACHPQWK